jgi:hypothetical protein
MVLLQGKAKWSVQMAAIGTEANGSKIRKMVKVRKYLTRALSIMVNIWLKTRKIY